ncbi:MAG: hypothetical protein ACE5HT_15105 [Gemmatimonadales bacterium]
MIRFTKAALVAGVCSLGVVRAAIAQESMPRITFAGTGLVSFNMNGDNNIENGNVKNLDLGTVNDFSDSFILLRLDRQLYKKDRAGFMVGFLFPDARNDLGQVFYNQVNVFYNSRRFGGLLGRSRLRNFVVEFPTLREEDLLDYGFVANPFINSENSELTRYGNVFRGDAFLLSNRLTLSGQVLNWSVTDETGKLADNFDVNGVSGSLIYRLPDALRYSGTVREAGIAVFGQNINAAGQNWMSTVSAGIAVNLTKDPLRNVEFRGQVIYNLGVDDLATSDTLLGTLAAPRGRARSQYLALAGSLRLLSRPAQLDRFQAALTVAYKDFSDDNASQFAVIPNVFFRVGEGVDLGVQYQFEQFSGDLARLRALRRQQSVKLTLAFRFQAMFNNYFGDRDDILNIEHGYIP